MNWQKLWKERGSTIASGIAALIIIIVGFLLFNTTNQKTTEKKPETTSTQTEEKKSESETEKQTKTTETQASTKLPAKYTVQKGDYLSTISKKYYGDGNKWTLIANENKLANPQVIHSGNVLKIPEVGTVSSASTNTAKQPSTYTVAKGDSLWAISERYFGNGYQWYRLRDANPGKVGLLSNGRPLIHPGAVLKIPAI